MSLFFELPYDLNIFSEICKFKFNEVVEEATLVLQVFLNNESAVEDLFYCAPPCSKSSRLFGQQFHGHTFQSIKDDAKHDFAETAD
ncbi:hypothetical protein DPMN_011381 [Dreissena polymorpha]|uniref:Uncharacterized protein n=1 Tax=Dreissena polymorpha TaxID=45954 RepID=A0A9D4N3Y3_DREPO|nr:hypothetical protein DPMN_011381 [Dreissena polymorpha]